VKPSLLTFDIFGTVLDWRAGLGDTDFDRIVDAQGELEEARFRPYARTARELGLTCVFVRRPHSRPGEADVTVPDLAALADLLDAA